MRRLVISAALVVASAAVFAGEIYSPCIALSLLSGMVGKSVDFSNGLCKSGATVDSVIHADAHSATIVFGTKAVAFCPATNLKLVLTCHPGMDAFSSVLTGTARLGLRSQPVQLGLDGRVVWNSHGGMSGIYFGFDDSPSKASGYIPLALS